MSSMPTRSRRGPKRSKAARPRHWLVRRLETAQRLADSTTMPGKSSHPSSPNPSRRRNLSLPRKLPHPPRPPRPLRLLVPWPNFLCSLQLYSRRPHRNPRPNLRRLPHHLLLRKSLSLRVLLQVCLNSWRTSQASQTHPLEPGLRHLSRPVPAPSLPLHHSARLPRRKMLLSLLRRRCSRK